MNDFKYEEGYVFESRVFESWVFQPSNKITLPLPDLLISGDN